jgi:hypothetical protein
MEAARKLNPIESSTDDLQGQIDALSCPSRGDREGAIQQDRVSVSIAGSVPSVFFFDSLLSV